MFFQTIDDFLIDRVFEPLAHEFQRLTGKTNFWLARWSAVSSYLLFLNLVVWFFPTHLRIVGWVVVVLGFFSTLARWLLTAESGNSNIGSLGAVNIARYRRQTARIVLLLVNLAGVPVLTLPFLVLADEPFIAAIVIVMFSLDTASEYFLACTPLPPGTSRFRRWLNKLLRKVRDMLAPEPEPAPRI